MDVEIRALAEIDADCRTQHARLPLHGILVVNIAFAVAVMHAWKSSADNIGG